MKENSILDFMVKIRHTWIYIMAALPMLSAVLYIYVVPDVIDLMSKEMWVLAALILLTQSILLLLIVVSQKYKNRKSNK